MSAIYGIAVFFSLGLLLPIVLLNVPLLAVVFAVRGRLQPRVISLMVAGGFVAAGAWRMYQMEWYDVWRHGMPSASYLLTGYLPYLLALGFIGWLVGRLISSISQRRAGKEPGEWSAARS
jgi:hypothetical protein